jgi:hypothetical protein
MYCGYGTVHGMHFCDTVTEAEFPRYDYNAAEKTSDMAGPQKAMSDINSRLHQTIYQTANWVKNLYFPVAEQSFIP